MKKTFTLFFLLLCNMIGYKIIAQSDYQEARFNTSKETNFYTISENVKKVLLEKKSKAITPSEKKSIEKEFKQFGRWQYYWKDFVNPDGSLPIHCLDLNLLYLKPNSPLATEQVESSLLNTKNWKQVGPTARVDAHEYTAFPGMGRVNVVRKLGPTSYIAGTPQGGIWKTTDNGTNWLPKTDGIALLGISDIRVNPNDPMKMFAVTGDREKNTALSIGVIKSLDGGETWDTTSLVVKPELNKATSNLGVKPNNPNHMLAVVQQNVYFTTDAWSTYTKGANMQGGLDVLYLNDFILISDLFGRIFRSTDNGANFIEIYNNDEGEGNIALRFNSTLVGDDVYFLAGKKNGAILYKASIAQIMAATEANKLVGTKVGTTIPDYNPQGIYNVVLAINPLASNKIIVLGVDGYYSTDGAATWSKKLDAYNSKTSGETYVHPDHHFAEFMDDTTVLIGHDGGVSIVNVNTQPFRHTDITGNMIIGQIYHGAIYNSDMNNENFLLGLQDNDGFSKSPSTKSGNWVAVNAGDGTAAGINHRNPLIRFMGGTHGTLYRTTTAYLANYNDQTRVIASDENSAPFVCEVVIHDQNPDHVFAGHGELKYSKDAGLTFQNVGQELLVGPTDEVDQYADRIAVIGKNGQKLAKYDTVTGTFSNVTNIVRPAGISVNFNSICLASTSNTVIYASIPGLDSVNKVFKSTDNGLTWTNITFDLPNVIVRKVLNQVTGTATFEEIIYVATNVGVYGLIRETENSKKWIKVGKMFPNVTVYDLDINYTALKMYASTHGRGLWELDVNYSVNSTGINDNKISEDQFQVYPNPSIENQSIQIGLPEEVDEAKYTLFNYVGGNLKSGNLTKSDNVISMDGIVPGLYLLSFEVNKIKYCKKIVVQ
jgi:hypothetical protein